MTNWEIIMEAERNAWRALEEAEREKSVSGPKPVDSADAKVGSHIPGPLFVEPEPTNLRGDE